MTTSPYSLIELSERYETAEGKLDSAKKNLAADKDSRLNSISARVVDFFTKTPAEKQAAKASDEFEKVKADTVLGVSQGLRATAIAYLEQDNADLARTRSQHYDRGQAILSGIEKAEELLELAYDTYDDLTAAARSAKSAADSKAFTFASKSKGVSLLSAANGAMAELAIGTASRSLDELADALPERHPGLDDKVRSDVFDIMANLGPDLPGMELISLSNWGTLTDAARDCSRMANRVDMICGRLERALDRSDKLYKQEQDVVLDIDRPYLARAAETVPDNIRFAIPAEAAPPAPSPKM